MGFTSAALYGRWNFSDPHYVIVKTFKIDSQTAIFAVGVEYLHQAYLSAHMPAYIS